MFVTSNLEPSLVFYILRYFYHIVQSPRTYHDTVDTRSGTFLEIAVYREFVCLHSHEPWPINYGHNSDEKEVKHKRQLIGNDCISNYGAANCCAAADDDPMKRHIAYGQLEGKLNVEHVMHQDGEHLTTMSSLMLSWSVRRHIGVHEGNICTPSQSRVLDATTWHSDRDRVI